MNLSYPSPGVLYGSYGTIHLPAAGPGILYSEDVSNLSAQGIKRRCYDEKVQQGYQIKKLLR